MRFFLLLFPAIVLLGVFPSLSFAQQNNFKTYSIEDGLSQSTVFAIIQDTRGYLWLGTDGGGLSRFDGKVFETYDKKKGLNGNTVRALMEDSRGNIWIGTEEGITIYNGRSFRSFNRNNGLPKGPVICFLEDDANYIWAGTAGGGLAKIKRENQDSITVTSFTTADGLESGFIFDICQDRQNRLWLATYGAGINILEQKGKGMEVSIITKEDGIPSNIILGLEEDKEGNIWAGTYDAGAFKMITSGADSGKIYSYNLINGINDNRVWSIITDSKGVVWFGTDEGGLNRFQNSQFVAFTEQNGLPNNRILCVFEDKDGIIWAGTSGSGLCKFNRDHLAHYSEKDGLSNNQVSGIVQDQSGTYWLSSQNGLTQMTFLNSQPLCRVFTTNDGLINNAVKSIALAGDGTLWLATDGGLSRMKPPVWNNKAAGLNKSALEFKNYSKTSGLIDDVVNCIFVDRDGRIWCGTRGGVSMMLGDDAFVNINEDAGLINNEVQTIIQDRKGNIWFGTLGGLVKTDMKKMVTYDEVEGLFDKSIHCLAEDAKGNIWIGTFGGGLYKMNVNTKDSIPIKFIVGDSLLGSNNIYSLIFQDDHTLIVGSEKGFDKITLDDNQNIVKVKNYDASDGFIGVENNLNAIYKDNKSNIWFGTVKGVTRYSPSLEYINKIPPGTHITGLKLFYKKVDWSQQVDSVIPWFNLPNALSLPYFNNHLTFNYRGISLNNPQKVFYRFRLEGLENDWSPPRKEAEAIYSGLSPGEYTFNVISKNENGIWNEKPVKFHFVIRPPFWQTWWFYLLCAFVSLACIIIFIKIRERNLLLEKAILEQKVRERTKELAEKNKEITDSINYAQNIQRAILPSIKSIERGFKDSFVLFRPRDIVSGDFYWYASKNGKSFIAACDCTGHGVPGAFVSMIGNNLLNQIILEKNIEKPGEILTMLNKGVKLAFTQDGEQEAQDGMDMVLSVLDTKNGTLEFASANNPMLIIRNGEMEIMKADRTPIGGDTDLNYQFENHVIKIKPNDQFYMSSDGFPDQFGGGKGKKFMIKRYKQMILDNYQKTMKEQRQIYQDELLSWMGTLYEQIDDILVIGIKVG